MGYMITAYTKNGCQENILPIINNANYVVTLDNNILGIPENIDILLDIIDNKWRFNGTSDNCMIRDDSIRAGDILGKNTAFQLSIGSINIALIVSGFPSQIESMKKYVIQDPCQLRIGTEKDNDIICADNPLISRYHAILSVERGTCSLTDVSKNGIIVDGKRIVGTKLIPYGSCISIFGTHIIWLGKIIAIESKRGTVSCNLSEFPPTACNEEPQAKNTYDSSTEIAHFRRSPRNIPSLFSEKINIETPPQPHSLEKRPLLLTIGPSLTMALPMLIGTGIAILGTQARGGVASTYMYTGIIIAVLSALIGTIWTIVNLRYAKKQELAGEQLRVQKYGEYLENREKEIKEKYNYNRESLNYLYPEANRCLQYTKWTPELWNRSVRHKDFLFLRLGTGFLPFQCPITCPEKKFSLTEDTLAERAYELKRKYEKVQDVPVGIDLKGKKLVGIVGLTTEDRMQIVRNIVLQAAASICYTDLKMVFLINGNTPSEAEAWSFAKWLPHVWSADHKVRYFATNENEVSEVSFAISGTLRTRSENGKQDFGALIPHYLFILTSTDLIEGNPIAKYLLDSESDIGVTTVILAERLDQLPNNCVDVIENDATFKGTLNSELGNEATQVISFDLIPTEKLEEFSRTLSAVKVTETETGGELPSSLSFLELYNTTSLSALKIEERWIKNRTYESLKVPIGQKAGGTVVNLDIHEKYHGPHGLVAGTTGSGKSETLQTYILSLAVNFSPNDVAFFLIDFKGGGMANLFENLPHTAGSISNLSGNQIHRAMVSIKSENRRRQKIFGEYSVNHIDQYTRLYKSGEASLPIPHLFIIIDEFAELKRNEPDFMRELISVAQVGRSLGVHLILATQKPSGTVDDNIWSNTRFKLCLRVQDKQDSNDVLHKPDAAYLSQAGRCYMQIGNDEVYELFQSGWSGAEYYDDSLQGQDEIAYILNNTGHSAIPGNTHKTRQLEKLRIKWLSTLLLCVEETRSELKIRFEDIGNDTVSLSLLYQKIRETGYDFPLTQSNTARVQDFIKEYSKLKSNDLQDSIQQTVKALQTQGKKIPELREKTQLIALVDYIKGISNKMNYDSSYALWLPVLPQTLYWFDICKETWFDGNSWPNIPLDVSLSVPIAFYDDPTNQLQDSLSVDFVSMGNLAICGASGSGKSTLLQTLLYALVNKYSPEQINLYALDYSNHQLSPFEKLAHTGDIIYDTESEKTEKLFVLLLRILNERKTLFQGGSYAQYTKLHGRKSPYIIVVIDNYASFREKTDNRFENEIVTLAREGTNYGIYFAIAAGGFGGAEIQNRLSEQFRNVVCLEMTDRFKYAECLGVGHFETYPEANTKGRGISVINGEVLEFQTALALKAADDYDRLQKLDVCFNEMAAAWKGSVARRVPIVPAEPVWSDFVSYDWGNKESFWEGRLPFGWNTSDASLSSIDLSRTYCWLINGKARTGKSNLLKVLAMSAAKLNSKRIIIEVGKSALCKFAAENEATYINDGQGLFSEMKELLVTFKERNAKKQQLINSGLDEEEIYNEMCQVSPIFIFIDGLSEFIKCVYTPSEGVGNMSGFLENITEKGRLHNIYIIATVDTTDPAILTGTKLFNNMISYRAGIHLGGNVSSQRLFDFSSLPYSEQQKNLAPGVGLLPPDTFQQSAKEVKIPLIKR